MLLGASATTTLTLRPLPLAGEGICKLHVMKRILLPALVAILLIVTWQAWVTIYDIPQFLVPSPLVVAQTLINDWSLLGSALLVTLKVTFLALICSVLLGVLIAFAFVQSPWIETAFFPYAVLLQVTPIVAIAPLLIIWIKNPTASLVVCATIVRCSPSSATPPSVCAA